MSLRRVAVLFGKEILQGPKNFIFIMALGMPVVFTLLVSLIFGTFLSGKSRLGIVDHGSSQLVSFVQENEALSVSTYASPAELEDAVGRGAVDMGLALPAEFDHQIRASDAARITVFVWGESHMQNRIILSAAMLRGVRSIAGQELPVEVVQAILGEGVNVPWETRLLPMLVLMTIMMAGTMVPSASLVNEKAKRTLSALSVSPATLLEVFAAKGLLGMLLSVFTGVLILFLNRAFGGQPLLLVGVLTLGSIFSASIGVLLGVLVKDISTLFATIKSLGIFLYAPGVIYLFPELPEWIGRVFPTYYIIEPVLQISQQDAGFTDVALEVAVLVGLILVTFAVLAGLSRRVQKAEAAA